MILYKFGQAELHNINNTSAQADENGKYYIQIQFDIFGDQFTQQGYDPGYVTGDKVEVEITQGPDFILAELLRLLWNL